MKVLPLASVSLAAVALALALPRPISAQQRPEDGRGQGLFDASWHAERRAALFESFRGRTPGVIVLRGASTQDDYREFRQDNNFWYFTGVTTPDAVLVLVPDAGTEVLYTPPVADGVEVWVGDLVDPAEAGQITGIQDTRPTGRGPGFGVAGYQQLEKDLAQLAKTYETFYVQEQPAENWMMSRDNLQIAQRAMRADPFDGRLTRGAQFAAKLREKFGVTTKDITPLIDAMRVVKTAPEVEAMRMACEISGRAHQRAMKFAEPGVYEWQLAAEMTGEMLRAGAMGPAYMAIVGSGPNAVILHYTENTRALEGGDVVMIDYGAEFNHYVADVSRSWPVSGTFTPRQREVYEAVYAAQEAAFEQCKPGSNLMRVHRAASQEIARRGFGKYFNHGTSHWLGMATHDVGNFGAAFEPGATFTVEPGVYIPEENLGVRIEDVVHITADGYELLTAGIPRHPDEIEALRP